MSNNIRSPIIVVVGHADHGKTSLLDRIRGTTVTGMEAGEITQHTGASYVPTDVIKGIAGNLLEKFKIDIKIPGLLFIDVPGHKAFFGMRKRGGSVSDMAILIVDANEGFQEQTYESLKILKDFKTPFVVAATKIDRISGWYPAENSSFLESFNDQRDDVKGEVENAVYKIVSQLSEKGFDSERFDRITDFKKQVAVVPISSKTGEGIPDLLMMVSGIAQQFLADKLEKSDEGKGSILEVKDYKGLGNTIDVILYSGSAKKGDYIIVGGREPVVTRVKALLEPRRMQELRTEKMFEPVDEVHAAAGVKINAPGLEDALAGSPVIFVSKESDVEAAKKEVQQEVEEVTFEKAVSGVTIRADTLGSLEAMIKILNEEEIPIRKAEVGNVNKQDVFETQNTKDRLRRVILAFNVQVPEDIGFSAKDLGVKVFNNQVIYRLVEDYQEWMKAEQGKALQEKTDAVTHPCEIKILKGCIFRQSNPAVFGVEVLRGVLKPGIFLEKDGKKIDRVKEIGKEGKPVSEAIRGDKVAVSLPSATVGRHINEGDTLRAYLTKTDLKTLKEIFSKLKEDEKDLLAE